RRRFAAVVRRTGGGRVRSGRPLASRLEKTPRELSRELDDLGGDRTLARALRPSGSAISGTLANALPASRLPAAAAIFSRAPPRLRRAPSLRTMRPVRVPRGDRARSERSLRPADSEIGSPCRRRPQRMRRRTYSTESRGLHSSTVDRVDLIGRALPAVLRDD